MKKSKVPEAFAGKETKAEEAKEEGRKPPGRKGGRKNKRGYKSR